MRTRPDELEFLVARAKSEFIEMPGLRLSIDQGSRLWGLHREECEAVLRVLVDRKFLSVSADGTYRRATDITAFNLPLRPAKASTNSQTTTGRSASTPANRRLGGRSSRD